MGAASRLSTKSDIVTQGDKAIHPNVLFRPNKQAGVAMVRTMISFRLEKNKIDPIAEIENVIL